MQTALCVCVCMHVCVVIGELCNIYRDYCKEAVAWITCPPPSPPGLSWNTSVDMRSGDLGCPHQASFQIWQCKAAANWEQDPYMQYIVCVGKYFSFIVLNVFQLLFEDNRQQQ